MLQFRFDTSTWRRNLISLAGSDAIQARFIANSVSGITFSGPSSARGTVIRPELTGTIAGNHLRAAGRQPTPQDQLISRRG